MVTNRENNTTTVMPPNRSWGPQEHRIVAHRQEYKCATCARLLPPTFELDHIVALADGGADCWLTNAQCLCNGCHALKTQRENIERRERRRKAERLAYEEKMKAIKDAREAFKHLERSHSPPPHLVAFTPQEPVESDTLISNNPFLQYAWHPSESSPMCSRIYR